MEWLAWLVGVAIIGVFAWYFVFRKRSVTVRGGAGGARRDPDVGAVNKE